MSRKQQICNLVGERPRTTRDIADALGIKVSTARVAVANAHGLGLIQVVGEEPRPGSKPVYVWGPIPTGPFGDGGVSLQRAWR